MTRAKDLLQIVSESVEVVNSVRVAINPRRFSRLAKELQLEQDSLNGNRVRFLVEKDGEDAYYWPSYYRIHENMAKDLGLDYSQCWSGEIMFVGGSKGWDFVREVRDGRQLDEPEVVAELLRTFKYAD
jgi:hypothetical protein